MRGSYAEYEKQQLMKQIDFTLQKTKVLADSDAFLRKATGKPIQMSFYMHGTVFMFFSLAIYGVTVLFHIPEPEHGYLIIPTEVLIYLTFVFLVNRIALTVKAGQYGKDIRIWQQRRREAWEDLHKYSDVPKKYWKFSYLLLMKSYLDNLRADTMKECLNLLEADIRHQQLQSKIAELEEHYRTHTQYHSHHHSHRHSYDMSEEMASGYEEETTYVDDESVEGTVYDGDAVLANDDLKD